MAKPRRLPTYTPPVCPGERVLPGKPPVWDRGRQLNKVSSSTLRVLISVNSSLERPDFGRGIKLFVKKRQSKGSELGRIGEFLDVCRVPRSESVFSIRPKSGTKMTK